MYAKDFFWGNCSSQVTVWFPYDTWIHFNVLFSYNTMEKKIKKRHIYLGLKGKNKTLNFFFYSRFNNQKKIFSHIRQTLSHHLIGPMPKCHHSADILPCVSPYFDRAKTLFSQMLQIVVIFDFIMSAIRMMSVLTSGCKFFWKLLAGALPLIYFYFTDEMIYRWIKRNQQINGRLKWSLVPSDVDKLTVACLSVEGRAEGPGDQSRESRPAGPNFIQLLSNRDRMVNGWRI